MRRERSQSSDRGRPYVPRWDNPAGQLPGTGIFVNSSSRFLIPNLHPICTCSCLFTPLTEGRSARDLTQAATSQKKKVARNWHSEWK